MNKTLVSIVLLALTTPPALASDQSDVTSAVRKFVDAINHGDEKATAAICADETSIVDEFPPHEWHGAGACLRWMADYGTDAEKNGITDGFVTLGEPRHVDVAGDLAYAVFPADYAFKQKGAPVKETGSTFTLALQKSATGWRITGWAWGKQ